MTELEMLQAERDRLVFELAEARSALSRAKATIVTEHEARVRATELADAVKMGWNSTLRTKEAMSELASLTPEDADTLMVIVTAREKAEQEAQTLREASRQREQELLTVTGLHKAVSKALPGFADEVRAQFFTALFDDYCEYCGRALGVHDYCHCENDD